MEMRWATFIDRNWVGRGWEGDRYRCRVLVPLCQIPFTCLIDLITNRAYNSDAHTFWVIYEAKHSEVFSRTASAVRARRIVWSGCGCLMLESVFVGYFCSTAQLRLGCIWDIDEKGWGQNVAFSYLKALSVSLGFQSVLSAERKMVVWNLLCRLYWIGSGRSLFFSRCLAQGRWVSTIRTLLGMYFLFKWTEPIDVDLIGPSVIEGLFHALCLSHFSLIPEDFEVWH